MMKCNPIPLYRAAHLSPYLSLLRKIGAPVDSGLRHASLPTMLVDHPDARIPLLNTLDFLTEMSQREGIEDLAFRAREQANVQELSPALLKAIRSAPTLKIALQATFKLAKKENSQLDIWMSAAATDIRINHKHRVPFDIHNSRHLELNTNMWLIGIIRAFAGASWYPGVIGFRSPLPLSGYTMGHLPNTLFLVGQKASWIELPRALLRLPLLAQDPPTSGATVGSANKEQIEMDFPTSLKYALQAYLADGYPHIDLAARISGMSVRSLQRRLSESDCKYSELVQMARFEAAKQLLQNPDVKVIDAAYALGYEDPSNFSRAFKRIAGISPCEFQHIDFEHQSKH